MSWVVVGGMGFDGGGLCIWCWGGVVFVKIAVDGRHGAVLGEDWGR